MFATALARGTAAAAAIRAQRRAASTTSTSTTAGTVAPKVAATANISKPSWQELVDVLTPTGQLTGRTEMRRTVHDNGLWHRVVHNIVHTPDGWVLHQRRAVNKEIFPGRLDFTATGHNQAGDDAETTAIKEMAEETGLLFDKGQLKHLLTARYQRVLNGNKIKVGGRVVHDREFVDVFVHEMNISDDFMAQLKPEVGSVSGFELVHYMDLLRLVSDVTEGLSGDDLKVFNPNAPTAGLVSFVRTAEYMQVFDYLIARHEAFLNHYALETAQACYEPTFAPCMSHDMIEAIVHAKAQVTELKRQFALGQAGANNATEEHQPFV